MSTARATPSPIHGPPAPVQPLFRTAFALEAPQCTAASRQMSWRTTAGVPCLWPYKGKLKTLFGGM